MKKGSKKGLSIGAKIYSVLGVLLIAFMAYNVMANLGLNQAKDAIESLSNTYMKMQEHNEAVSKNTAEARLYSNLIMLLPDETSANEMAKLVPNYLSAIEVSLDEMTVLAQ